eukprot:TRINITY_DN10675_c0_g1_i1.p2 TRINITY_DN10675_c0_g1~~TRINITY_DN10675_c0_g1_i1.p2  ORF type:complete len:170 (+),score=35.70 TRINITY_DN10675_c0_g1_i1:65-574(+)
MCIRDRRRVHGKVLTKPIKAAIVSLVSDPPSAQLPLNYVGNDSNREKLVVVHGKIAYVAQNTWLRNISVRENITYGYPFRESWYRKCVEACQLAEEIQKFPNQDFEPCGPNGGNLSGGQRQRIAICRAIYSDADIYIFDDPLSSLDIHVADAIMKQVIRKLLILSLIHI